MRPVRRVAFFGETGIGNYGNEASLVAGLRLLDGTEARALAVAQLPAVVEATLGLDAVEIRHPSAPRRGIKGLLGRVADVVHLGRTVRSVDAVVVPGTGIFEGQGQRPRGIPFSLFWLAAWSRVHRRPLLLLSVGVDDQGSPGVRWFFARTLSWSAFVTVRDEGSARAVAGLGVRRETAVVPDLVLRRGPVTADPALGTAQTDPLVAVGVMDWGGTERDADRERYTGRGVVLVRALLDTGAGVRVVTGEDLDLRVAREVVRRVREADPRAAVELSEARTVEDVAHALGGCHALVAARYHNLVAAVSEGVPVVATGYGPKQAALVAHYAPPGRGRSRAHDRDTYDTAAVVAQVREILADHAAESAWVRDVAESDRAAVVAQEDRARDLLGLRAARRVAS
ncbi:polysaccharide pyruvyl transferase family protein [Isoptericola sp. 4D.3]|uniref:Polysaccharide pyruvyl transferase family protein n=1 Tax=Isoptericola peretonis TaxID=2918523 RepID=A0ABT0J5Q8_9MICO|nr:polysaccharide pyruvyl transferase family protein [Isoptericola sp. 4D.3]